MDQKFAKDTMNVKSQAENVNAANPEQMENDNVPKNVPEENPIDGAELIKNQMKEEMKDNAENDSSNEDDTLTEETGVQTLEEAVNAAIEESSVKKEAQEDPKQEGNALKKEVADDKSDTEPEDANARAAEEQRSVATSYLLHLLLFIFCQMFVICLCSMYAEEIYAFVYGLEARLAGFFCLDPSSDSMTVIYMLGALLQLYVVWILHGRIQR